EIFFDHDSAVSLIMVELLTSVPCSAFTITVSCFEVAINTVGIANKISAIFFSSDFNHSTSHMKFYLQLDLYILQHKTQNDTTLFFNTNHLFVIRPSLHKKRG